MSDMGIFDFSKHAEADDILDRIVCGRFDLSRPADQVVADLAKVIRLQGILLRELCDKY